MRLLRKIFARNPAPTPAPVSVRRDVVMRLIDLGMKETDVADRDIDSAEFDAAKAALDAATADSTPEEIAAAHEALRRHGY